jgi:CRISPR-associated protein Cas2
MRIRYIVSYDISDEKRLRRVHRTMKGYGDTLQYSVFRCDLSASERILMIEALSKIINHREDQIMLVDIGPADGRGQWSIETIGRAHDYDRSDRIAVIV